MKTIKEAWLLMIVEANGKALKDLSKINKQEALKIFSKIEKLEEFPKVANLKNLLALFYLIG